MHTGAAIINVIVIILRMIMISMNLEVLVSAKHARVLSSIHFNNNYVFEPSHAFNDQPFHSFPQATPAIKPSATILLCVDATPAC